MRKQSKQVKPLNHAENGGFEKRIDVKQEKIKEPEDPFLPDEDREES